MVRLLLEDVTLNKGSEITAHVRFKGGTTQTLYYPLPPPIARGVEEADLVVAGVLSGNRNFEGRINPLVKANYLASPLLVVSYALAGTMDIDLTTDPIGEDARGEPVYLKDLWPSPAEVQEAVGRAVDPEMFRREYEGIEGSNPTWNEISAAGGVVYGWDEESTYIQEPPFFVGMSREAEPISPIRDAKVLVMVGDSVTTDHISPAGAIPAESPAGAYLRQRGVEVQDFNSYGSRRGNDWVMTRGTFANIRLRNLMAPGTEGGSTTHVPTGEVISIFEASRRYLASSTPTIVLAGKDYGMGSSRDWAAKGTLLLGIRAVIAESFERIHRSNLVGMGVLPLQFKPNDSVATLDLTGKETFTIALDDNLKPGQDVTVTATDDHGGRKTFTVTCRIDTPIEVDYYRHGGILHYVLRQQ